MRSRLLLAMVFCAASPVLLRAENPPAAVLAPGELSDPAPTGASERLSLSVQEAVLMALENNRALRMERITPLVREADEQVERAAFDFVLGGEISDGRERADAIAFTNEEARATTGAASLSKKFSVGADVALDVETTRDSSLPEARDHTSRAGLSITQALLRGAGRGPNLANLRQARLDYELSEYELRGFAEALVAEVEVTYWAHVLAQRQIEIYERSLQLAEQQLAETLQRVRVGSLAETELAAAQAENALRREALIGARGRAAALRARLVRLVYPAGLGGGVQEILSESAPRLPDELPGTLEEHLAMAVRLRPELNEARLRLKRQDLDLVKTRNGLLPRLDLFVRLGKSGYAASFDASVSDLDGDSYDASAGLELEWPLGRREARARHRQAQLTRAQAGEAMANLGDLIREDVEIACIEVAQSREQIAATSATRTFQEENLRAEMAKFRSGKSTSLSVAQVQRDLVSSEIAEVEAIVRHLQALVVLYRNDGSLLLRRRIAAPGAEPANE